ncbi:MAG: hypothetical protein JWP44_4264, partial [Mucilaginibacter sp.]|nr:hypothetical protein [Mucilaginibacter sp.]
EGQPECESADEAACVEMEVRNRESVR